MIAAGNTLRDTALRAALAAQTPPLSTENDPPKTMTPHPSATQLQPILPKPTKPARMCLIKARQLTYTHCQLVCMTDIVTGDLKRKATEPPGPTEIERKQRM